MNKLIFSLLIIVSWGCASEAADPIPEHILEMEDLTIYSMDTKPAATISFTKGAVYGESDEGFIGRMGDISVDRLGRVFIADVQKQLIYVFESNGRFITQLGREGKGPGEFSYVKSLQTCNDFLYAFDANFGIQRVSLFTLDTLATGKTIVLARNRSEYISLAKTYPGIHKIYLRNDCTYLAEFVTHNSNPNKEWQNVELWGLLHFLDSTGEITSNKLFEFVEEIRTYKWGLVPIKPFFGNAFIVLLSDNTIYWAGPEYFLIKVYSPEGVYRQAFHYPLKKIPLTQESAGEAEVHDLYIQNMKFMDLPQTWPVLTDMKIDDHDRLWIATTVEDMTIYEWWILEKTGELITKFEWPRDEPIEVVKNGYMYTRETDEETGLQRIVRYRVEFEDV
ncbi:MAG: 6-bladed beta-propeller [Balneolaceae bacterium]|nr:MAG: 6-bladed beta-propeller [Balneolaceae bacterium]